MFKPDWSGRTEVCPDRSDKSDIAERTTEKPTVDPDRTSTVL